MVRCPIGRYACMGGSSGARTRHSRRLLPGRTRNLRGPRCSRRRRGALQPSSTFIDLHQPSSTFMCLHRPSATQSILPTGVGNGGRCNTQGCLRQRTRCSRSVTFGWARQDGQARCGAERSGQRSAGQIHASLGDAWTADACETAGAARWPWCSAGWNVGEAVGAAVMSVHECREPVLNVYTVN